MENKIVVRHSSIVINNYERGDCEKLENILSIWDPNYYVLRPIAYYYDELNKKLYLPRGLDIPYIERLFNAKATIDQECDKYAYTTLPILARYEPRDNVQKEALRFMLGKAEYSAMRRKSQQSLNLTTGKGKTYCSIITIACYSIKSAIITYSISWINQWKDCFLEYTDLKSRRIKIINSSSIIKKFLNDPKSAEQYDIFLFTHSTIKSFGDSNGWDKVTELFKVLKIGLKFYDESHLNFTNMCMIDFFTNTYKTYYVSASPARSNDDENRIYKLFLKNIPAISLFDEELDPHTSYISLRYNSHPTPKQISACKTSKYGLASVAYSDYVVSQPNFLKMIDLVLDLCFSVKGKCLFYLATNKSILILYDWILNNYPELYGNVGIYTSLTNGPDKEDNLNKKIILSTIQSCGTAKDIKGLSMTVIAASPFKSGVYMQQILGRTRDNNTLCVELIDIGFNQILRYYYHKKSVIEKYALDMSNNSFSDDELDYRVMNILEKRFRVRQNVCNIVQQYIPEEVVTFKQNNNKFNVVTIYKR